jgi:hypothetical protein
VHQSGSHQEKVHSSELNGSKCKDGIVHRGVAKFKRTSMRIVRYPEASMVKKHFHPRPPDGR